MSARHRYFEPGHIYHALNRGAERQQLFFCEADYAGFEQLTEQALVRTSLPILTYELMPNHWHFVVRPAEKDQLSEFFQYLAGTHAKRFRAVRGSRGEGHVYQDRFKTFPVESDSHLLALCRYVERNALRAGLVQRAQDWRWSGLWRRQHDYHDWLVSDWLVVRPRDWLETVNCPLTSAELRKIRQSVCRGRPLGSSSWTQQTAKDLGLEHTLRSPGRPPIASPKHAVDGPSYRWRSQ